jgi:Protein of unknown function (DUF2934)
MSKRSETGRQGKPARTSSTRLSGRQSVIFKSVKPTIQTTGSHSLDGVTTLDPQMRRAMIAEAAYYHAEKRGFMPGDETHDWLAAEAEIDRLLSARLEH